MITKRQIKVYILLTTFLTSLKISPVTSFEVAKEIKDNIDPKKFQVTFHNKLVTETAIKKNIVLLTYLVNAAVRLKYVQVIWGEDHTL